MTITAKGRVPPQLAMCHACKQFVRPEDYECPHCSADIARAALANADKFEQLHAAAAELRELLTAMGIDVDEEMKKKRPS